jgi:hypothetical protein
MYATVNDVITLLPENVTIGDQNIGTPIPGKPVVGRNKFNRNHIIEFIKFAQQEIDARLRPMYVPNLNQIIVDKLISSYDADSLVGILEYPDPIPLTAARLAASYAYDSSQYGNEMRKRAMFSIDSILTGAAILMGQEHVTKRFARMSLFDSFKTPTDDITFGRESQ